MANDAQRSRGAAYRDLEAQIRELCYMSEIALESAHERVPCGDRKADQIIFLVTRIAEMDAALNERYLAGAEA